MGRWTRVYWGIGISIAAAIVTKVIADSMYAADQKFYKDHPEAVPSWWFGVLEGVVPILGIISIGSGEPAGVPPGTPKPPYDPTLVSLMESMPFVVLFIGGAFTLYIFWRDVVKGESVEEYLAKRNAAMAAGLSTGVAVAAPQAAPATQPIQTLGQSEAEKAQELQAKRMVEDSGLPATGNPTTFERGTQARAVRDVLARHIEEGGGADQPYAVATAKVKEEGPAKAAEGLPPSEVKAELKEQTEAAAA